VKQSYAGLVETTVPRTVMVIRMKRTSIRHTIISIGIAVIVLALQPPPDAASEGFSGDVERIRLLGPEMRYTYFGLQYLLNRHQIRQFLSLETEAERRDWIDRFWIDNDPTPATAVNERRTEHELRVSTARNLFGMKKAPGWDRRGETLIRWGMPGYRVQTFGDIGFYREIPPGEMWYYESLDMLIQFHNYNLKGEFIYAIEPQGLTGRQLQDRLKLAIEHSLNHEMAGIYLTPEEVGRIANFNPDKIDHQSDPDVRLATPKDLLAGWEVEKLQRSANNYYKYKRENPVIHSFELGASPLPLYFDITAFRGGPDRIRTEINIEVPTGELRFINRGGGIVADVELKVLVRDFEMNAVDSASNVIQVSRASESGGGPSLIPGQAIVTLEPGYYRVGIEANDLHSGRGGSFRTNIELVSLDRPLSVSDIMFASSISETEEPSRFLKGNLRVVPHPIHAYRIPFPVTIYFEIYGLDTDSEGLAYYEVEYRIIPLEKRRRGPVLEEVPTAISSRFETTGFGPKQIQRLEIATDNLWKGPFELIVSVRDRRTRMTTEKRASFSILE
jgi:GWxTD domain-containing protein